MTKLVNLTPHEITIVAEGCNDFGIYLYPIRTIKPSGKVIRLSEKKGHTIGNVNGVEIVEKEYGYADYIPPVEKGTFYIVSGLVASAMKRADFLVPNTFRHEDGQIIGCDSFSIIVD